MAGLIVTSSKSTYAKKCGMWSDMQMNLIAENEEEPKSLLMNMQEQSGKAALKLNIKKTKIKVTGPITSWQIEGEKWKQGQISFSCIPK